MEVSFHRVTKVTQTNHSGSSSQWATLVVTSTDYNGKLSEDEITLFSNDSQPIIIEVENTKQEDDDDIPF